MAMHTKIASAKIVGAALVDMLDQPYILCCARLPLAERVYGQYACVAFKRKPSVPVEGIGYVSLWKYRGDAAGRWSLNRGDLGA